MVRIVAVQMDPRLGEAPGNLDVIAHHLAGAAAQGARLAVFPECCVTGYVFQSKDEALEVAEPIPGPSSRRIEDMAIKHEIHAVVGTLERDGDQLYNTAILAGPHGIEAIYRKTHTLCLGVDRFTTPGDIPYRVHDLGWARVGVLICYDLRFPEPSRVLGLKGAQMILLPTNWPESSVIQPEVFTRARAAENRVFVVAADRVGVERGAQFLGRSQIVGPDAVVLREASQDGVEMLIADIDPAQADLKNVVVRAGEHEMDCFLDRRPELYEDVTREILHPVGGGASS